MLDSAAIEPAQTTRGPGPFAAGDIYYTGFRLIRSIIEA